MFQLLLLTITFPIGSWQTFRCPMELFTAYVLAVVAGTSFVDFVQLLAAQPSSQVSPLDGAWAALE